MVPAARADPLVQRRERRLIVHAGLLRHFDRVLQLVAEDRDRIVGRAAQRDLDAHVALAVRGRQHHHPPLERARQPRHFLDVDDDVAVFAGAPSGARTSASD